MSEKLKSSPEQQSNSEALKHEGAERREALREQLERAGEKTPETNVETIRHEALEKAASAEKEKQRERQEASPAERRAGSITKKASYNATMDEIQTHMSPASRTFSKVIHNKTIEKASDVIGNTIARPNAILSGAVVTFIVTLAVYWIAKNMGYQLSGFEWIAAFALGWLLGLLYDFLRVMITGKR